MGNNKPEPGRQVRLVGLNDPYKGQIFVIDKDDFLIGRIASSDLSMPQSTISGHHARIQKIGDHFEIIDLQSTNGTFLNGFKVDRKHLRSEDKIRFDRFEFQFIDPGDVGRTMIRPAAQEMAKTVARDEAPIEPTLPGVAVRAVKKGSLLSGVIVGLVVSFLIGLVGNVVFVLLASPGVGFSARSVGTYLKSVAASYPAPHIPQTWLKQNWSDWHTIVSLGLIALAIIVGGILVQAIGKRVRTVSAFVFSLFYVIVAVLIQLAILKFNVQSLPGAYPALDLGPATWPNFALAVCLFFAVVLVVSFIGTAFVKRRGETSS